MTANDPIASGVSYRHHQVEVEVGVRLTVHEWQPGTGADPLVFVAGWISIIEGWRPLLEVLVRERPVIYIESREKRSAAIGPGLPSGNFARPMMARHSPNSTIICTTRGRHPPNGLTP